MSRTLKASSGAVAKNTTCYEETGSHEDCHRKGTPIVISAAEDKFIIELPSSEISAQINASQSYRHININCSQETA
jgi:hypothetical protein